MRDTIVNGDGVLTVQSTYADELDAVFTDAEANAIIAEATATERIEAQRVPWQRRRHDLGLARRVLTTFWKHADGWEPGQMTDPSCGHVADGLTCHEATCLARWFEELNGSYRTKPIRARDRRHAIRYAQSTQHSATSR